MEKLLRSLGLALAVLLGVTLATASAQKQPDGQADEDRERLVMERFLAILEKNPRRSTALDRVYGYHIERGSLENMIKTYRDRTAKDPKDGASWLLLGLFEAQRGRDAAAVTALRQSEKYRPEDPLPSYYLGQALVLVGQPDAAAEAFERAISRKPTRTDVLEIFQALGRVHQRAHHVEQALEVWNRLEEMFPNDARVKEQIAATLAEESEPGRALPRYEALAKSATDPYRKTQFRMDAAELKVKLNRQTEALADLESLLGQLNPESWLYREVRRRIEEVFLRNDDQAGLATYYEKWLQKTPEDVEAMARLGRTLASLGRVAEAQTWFDKAVKLAPSRRELRLALVEQLVQEKKLAEAAAQYEAMAKSDPNNPDLIREWGRLLLRDASRSEAQRKKAAAEVWRKMLTARPDDAAVAVQVADLFRQAEMPDDAVELYKKAIALAPEAPQYYEYLGEYYHSIKKAPEALETWGKIAEGKNRTAKNLARLAEVLSGFGYTKEALVPSAEACKLDADAFDFQLKYADLLFQLERFDDTLTQLQAAAKAAIDPEQSEAVLDLEVKTHQASGKLTERTDALRDALEAGKGATADAWRKLARMLEAGQRLPEAVRAIDKAVTIDPKSIASWGTYARLHEASGDLGGAVEAYQKLAVLDRRALTEYLTAVAKLEVRLGRRDRALNAGRDVLAAAPGNPESYQFFAELCAQLGEVEESLDTLRRAVRVNPSDSKALLTLAEALAREFRTEEAIELYWRAFAKATELDGKLSIVGRLTDLYLQRNQFDRLVARLDREGRESKQQRETAICLAQAYSASGDYGTARQELERLLSANPRDTALLQQLSILSETDGDLTNAAKYQRQLNEIAPSDDGTARLAQLYLRAGEANEAETIWAKMAGGKQDIHRILQSVGNLLANDKPQTALGITDRLLRDHPGHWEVLYREGVALAALEKPNDAAQRFRAILDLRLNDDDENEAAKAARKTKGNPATGARSRSRTSTAMQFNVYNPIPLQNRTNAVWQILQATGLQAQGYYGYGSQRQSWSPDDFGQARMAALGWLFSLAKKADKEESFLKEFQTAREKAPQDVRKLWDWYYLAQIRQESRETYEAARALARAAGSDPAALFAYLSALPARAVQPGQRYYVNTNDPNAVDKTPPLPKEELDEVLADYRALRARKPEWAHSGALGSVSVELKRAQRTDQREELYREAIKTAIDPASMTDAASLASERGDVAAVLGLADRQARLSSGQRNAPGMDSFLTAFTQTMVKLSDTKAHGEILKIFDHYFDWYTSPEQTANRLRWQTAVNQNSGNVQFQLTLGKETRWVTVDYPMANRYYDASAIQMLRVAFELFKRDDVLSDLFAHLRKRSEKDPEAGRVYATLGLGYVHWWNDDKDEAVRELARAAESLQGDPELKLNLAELRARRNEPDEALAIVDSVEPLDQKTMQRREVLALRLAVLSGNVDRARQASERLFNLRLDTQTQVQLAAQMHQLGMHDLAEAVLARARRRAGNNTNTLVGLMQQYQQQNKVDVAVQVAHQILRRSSSRTFSPYQDEGDTAEREAIQVLARSGKLKELIARVEAQLKASPNSVELLRTLAAYHKAAGDEAKAREALDRIAKLRPDDSTLRYQMGMQLVRGGDSAGAIDHFKAAFKKDPSLFGYRYWEIQNAFQQAGKQDELAQIFEETDLKKIGNYWTIEQLVSSLMQDEKTRERGIKLFRKMWAAFPSDRPNLIANFYSDEVWKLPEMYDYARQVVIPSPNQKMISKWAGVDSVNSWSGGGRVNGVADRLLGAAAKQNKLEALAEEIAVAMKREPEWSGGRVFLAMINVRRNRYDDAQRLIKELLANDTKEKDPIPHDTRLFLAQEIENYGPLQQVALGLYETADKEDTNNNGLDFEWHPVRRLIAMYRKLGRTAEARELVLKFAKRPDNNNYAGNPGYAAYRRVENITSIGRELLDLGFPADAVPLYGEALADPDTLRAVEQFYGGGSDNYMITQLRQGLNQGLRGINATTLAPTIHALLKPGTTGSGQALNLVVLVHPREVDRASVTSLFAEAARAAVKRSELNNDLKTSLLALLAKAPKDFSVHVAWCLVLAADGQAAPFAEAAGCLARLADENPLEDLSEGSRPNARQRSEAAKRLALWLVARECWKNDATRATGDALAGHAIEAARRQSDQLWILAMLREQGQLALARGDRAGAERTWTRLLEQILTSPGWRPKGASASKPAIPAGPKAKPNPSAIPTTTLDRFELAAQLSKLAASHDMPILSLRAAREALAGGPPVIPMPIDTNNNSGMMIQSSNSNDASRDKVSPSVEKLVEQLGLLWKQHQVPADQVYEVLRDSVIPASRPTEIFLYARPLAESVRQPKSVGAILAEWAGRAGKVDDLRTRAEARGKEPMAQVPAEILFGELALVTHDSKLINARLKALDERLKKDTLENSAMLACHVGIRALDAPETAPAAIALLEHVVKNLPANSGNEPLSGLHRALAAAYYKAGLTAEGRKHILDYQTLLARNMPNYGGDYGLYVRKQNLQQVAMEFARLDQWVDALDILGQFVDAPAYRGGDPSLGNVLTRLGRQFASLPARERYDRLKAWSLPTATRKSIRVLASYVPADKPPAVFGKVDTSAFEDGIASTPTMLIVAAREAGTLDDLAKELAGLADQKIENSQALLNLVQVARDLGLMVKPKLAARLAELKEYASKEPHRGRAILWADVLVARACLKDPALRISIGEPMAQALVTQSQRTANWLFLAGLRRDLAVFAAQRVGEPIEPGADPGLAYWHPASVVAADRHSEGGPAAWWAEYEGHVRHITGPQDEMLLFDYPLSGSFEFSADVFVGGWAEGQIGYGGLVMEANANVSVASAIFEPGRHDYLRLASRFSNSDAFNRMTVHVEPGRVRYLVNGHLFYEDDDPSPTAPWFMLFCGRDRQSTYRNLTLTGKPTIPHAVPLTHGDRLEGWVANFLGQSRPPRRSLAPNDTRREALASESIFDDYEWAARDGEIRGKRGESFAANEPVQGRLYYARPMRNGDVIDYEFYYEPGAVMVHPAMDRIAFLIAPDGVRLHWITDGLDSEWSGLKTSNVATEPENRRGPASLPLKEKAWNKARLSLKKGTAVLELNGVEIYARPLEADNSRQFGFFHFREQSAARVRNVVLRGAWPTEVPAEALANLATRRGNAEQAHANARARHGMINDDMLVRAAGMVLATARTLPAAAQYDYLADWVLPSGDYDDFRLQGIFTPSDAAPPAASPAVEPADNVAENRLHTGGLPEAPALDLVAVARQLGKLDELADRMKKADTSSDHGRRSRVALLALIHMAQKRDEEAKAELNELTGMVRAMAKDTVIWPRWPELLAQWVSLGQPKLRDASRALNLAMLDHWHHMNGNGIWHQDRDLWGHHLMYALRRLELLQTPLDERNRGEVAARLPLWSRVEHASAESRGQGKPHPRWWFNWENILIHGQGHRDDLLYLNVPLRGDFEITCEVMGFGGNQMHLAYGAIRTATRWDRKMTEVTRYGHARRDVALEPPLADAKGWYPMRLVVKDRKYTVYLQGRKVFEESLPAAPDPWLAIHQYIDGNSGLRDFKLIGSPTIPTKLELSALPDLTGWLADYYNERLDGDMPAWDRSGDEIVGHSYIFDPFSMVDRWGNSDNNKLANSVARGSKQESLLRYHRPMLEDGEIGYDFFYEPGKTEVHPALDRLAFVLVPDGVKIHWLTDAQYDRTGLSPDNLRDEPTNRRGSKQLPLKPNAWNRVALKLTGDTVSLSLNGQPIYERTLEATNNRQFGLFHYADETEARIRNATYEGNWPHQLPADLGFGPVRSK